MLRNQSVPGGHFDGANNDSYAFWSIEENDGTDIQSSSGRLFGVDPGANWSWGVAVISACRPGLQVKEADRKKVFYRAQVRCIGEPLCRVPYQQSGAPSTSHHPTGSFAGLSCRSFCRYPPILPFSQAHSGSLLRLSHLDMPGHACCRLWTILNQPPRSSQQPARLPNALLHSGRTGSFEHRRVWR